MLARPKRLSPLNSHGHQNPSPGSVRDFALTQDTHDPNTPEFEAYPPHCLRGTAESVCTFCINAWVSGDSS